MSLVARYKLNDDTTLTEDSVGSFNLTNVNNVGTVIDATYGTAASFVKANVQYLHTTIVPASLGGNSSRTYSSWVRPTVTSTSIISGQGEVSSTSGGEHQIYTNNNTFNVLFSGASSGGTSVNGTWFNVVVTYDGTTELLYVDGTNVSSRSIAYNTHSTGFAIGHHLRYVNLNGFNALGFEGQILDYRIYDDALSANDITDLYNGGPNPLLTTIPGPQSISISVEAQEGATGYRITSQKAGSNSEFVQIENFTDLEQTVMNLIPSTDYTIRLYSTTGTGFTLEAELLVTTLENSAENYDINEFLGTNGRFDISTLNNTSVGLISEVMNDLFTTDDGIDINISGRTRISKFVNRGDTVDVTNSDTIIAPFTTQGGSGQTISMTLSDTSSVSVSYDEITDAVTIGATTYDIGESLTLDGKKVTIVDI